MQNALPGTAGWFARHELTLSWRDFHRMITGGRQPRFAGFAAFAAIVFLFLHALSFTILAPLVSNGLSTDDTQLLVLLSAGLMLAFSLIMSQAMELVTRAFYARSDLDLILSSPVRIETLFAVRTGAIALSATLLSLLLFAPVIHAMVWLDGAHWFAAFPVIAGCGALATALSLAVTIFLFNSIGAKRTRAASQVVAAIVGAGFVIGIQLVAILSFNSYSRLEVLTSDSLLASVPGSHSVLWLPAKAIMGDATALLMVLTLCLGAFALSIRLFASGFAGHVLAAAGLAQSVSVQHRQPSPFKKRGVSASLRWKEWKLLLRDHWLLSQTLMQILYLLPPAFMLWQGFGNAGVLAVVVVPVLVMASGQLAGGLAWLAISGEDAPELVETAPISPGAILRSKVEAVLGAILVVVAPILLALCFAGPWLAVVTLAGVAASASAATTIQLWFRSQAKRSSFRRRQTSSKVATLAEAFSSISWAASAAFLASGSWLFVAPAICGLAVLAVTRKLKPTE